MKKLINFIIGFMISIMSIALIPQAYADINVDYTYYPYATQQFHPSHPDYYDGNLRLQLKQKADIERATMPNMHYDPLSGDYYTCNWEYNTNLGTWVCDKELAGSSILKIQICPFGSVFNYTKRTCELVNVPDYAHLNSNGDGFECNAGYNMNYLKTGCVKYGPYPSGTSTSNTNQLVSVANNTTANTAQDDKVVTITNTTTNDSNTATPVNVTPLGSSNTTNTNTSNTTDKVASTTSSSSTTQSTTSNTTNTSANSVPTTGVGIGTFILIFLIISVVGVGGYLLLRRKQAI